MQTEGEAIRRKEEEEEEQTATLNNDTATVNSENKEDTPKTSKLKVIWGKIGLDAGTVIMMFKGSLPPTIGIAIYQADAVAGYFTTLGYLVPIVTVLSMCIMPRAKFLQNLILNIIGICIGSAMSLLGIWTGVQARLHTQTGSEAYNSSQAAVCAIWLFANIWFVNVLRAKIPAFQLPVIMYSIFTNVAFTYGHLFPTIAGGEALIKELLTAFLSAFAIATAVSLFIVPVTSRTVVFKESAGYIMLLRGTIKAQTAYLQSLEKSDMFSSSETKSDGGAAKKRVKKKQNQADNAENIGTKFELSPESKALKASIEGLTALHGKLHGDLPSGKREFAWGKLGPEDLEEVFKLFQSIMIPLVGMSTIADIFERVAERRGWAGTGVGESTSEEKQYWQQNPSPISKEEEKRIWNEIMKQLHEPFAVVADAIDESLLHAGLLLEILPRPKAKKATGNNSPTPEEDVESKGDKVSPGETGFSEYLNSKLTEFYNARGETLRAWARQKGLSADQFDATKTQMDTDFGTAGTSSAQHDLSHRHDQQQLYLILYMEHLLYSTGVAVGKFVAFAEGKVESGQMKKNRLILPGKRRFKKWLLSIGGEDGTVSEGTPDSMESGQNQVYLGSGFNGKKDPEHLPATTAWEKFGNGLRTISHFLGSTESAFGFRVACATLTIGIIGFLKASYEFFIEQRLVWAMIIIAIGMSITSGQSMFGFFGRVAGTALSMVFSMVIWYIVDEKTAGVIVMLWFFIFMEMYFFLKFPKFIPVFLVCIVTQVLIVGYELQVEKIGIVRSSASGQPYYPVYELAPYRLACVAGGSFVAFIWTIFPYPLTDRSWLRKDLGATIYLLANYYSVVHTTIQARLHDTEGNMEHKQSPGRQLEKMRQKVFGKLLLLLPSLQQHAEWQKWELNVGGRYPRERYEGIIRNLTNIMRYLSLMSYSTQTWSKQTYPNSDPAKKRVWLNELSKLVHEVDTTSHALTSILSLLSASVIQGSALPPYLQMPEAYQLSKRLEALDRGILDSRHVEEPGYSAYAVLQVTSSLVLDDVEQLVAHVKALVGETDFSFHTLNNSSADSIGSSVDTAVAGSNSENGKGKRE